VRRPGAGVPPGACGLYPSPSSTACGSATLSDGIETAAPPRIPSGGRAEPLVAAIRVDLPGLTEIHLAARPDPATAGFVAQVRSAYAALLGALSAHGAGPAGVVAERIFLGDIAAQAEDAAAAGRETWGAAGGRRPASTILQQPPARPGQLVEIQALAAVAGPGGAPTLAAPAGLPPGASGCVVVAGSLRRAHLAGIAGGRPGDALGFRSQSDDMLARAEAGLVAQGLGLARVARTWLFLADIDHDYAELNHARRDFFTARNVAPAPASTGIRGMAWPPDRRCTMDLVAYDGPGVGAVRPLHAPTMNEAPEYGSDFSRAMRVDLGRRSIVYVSGTASIDAAGRVLHAGDPAAQARRMLLNVEQLLAGQNAGLDRIVQAVTYVKRAADRDAVLAAGRAAGLPGGIPHTICVADVCRPEWLCEMEAIAVLA
jgi:enamine deaminase RidA (YjgF/YER057c/UK114 family)